MSKAAELAALIGSQTALSNRNLIINGAMQVAQRGTSTTDSNGFGVDRFTGNVSGVDELVTTYSQSTTAPAGFTTSLKVNIDTAETAIASDEFIRIMQLIEAQNLQHLQYGSSGAKSLTLSFWVRSNVTGKYSVLFYQDDDARSNTQSYTINSADTWEYKTITIDGDTTGVIDNDNGVGLRVNWILTAGSDYAGTPHSGWGAYSATDDFAHSDMVQTFATTANNNWHITGVQLEAGETATPFEHEDFGTTLAKCRRYAYRYTADDVSDSICNLASYDGASNYGVLQHPVQMRSAPSMTYSALSAFKVVGRGNSVTATALTNFEPYKETVQLGASASTTIGSAYWLRFNAAGDWLQFDAEL